MKSFKQIQSIISKEDLIFNPTTIIRHIYGSFYNKLTELTKISVLYTYSMEEITGECNQLLQNLYTNPYFIDSINAYQKKLSIYKSLLNEFDNKLYYNKVPFAVNDINSFFYVQQYFNSNYEKIFITIQHKNWNYQYLYFDIDRKYTKIINYLGFLNKFQYEILVQWNDSLSNYLGHRMEMHPKYLDMNSLKDQLYYIITDYINENTNVSIDDIKKHWLLPEFTDKDNQYFNSCLAKKLLKNL